MKDAPMPDRPSTNGKQHKHVEDRFDDLALNQRVLDIVANTLAARQAWLDRMTGGGLDRRRNLYDECGYPKSGSLDATHYQELYDREPIAGRVVEVMPKQSWQVQPRVYELEDGDEPTAFEKAWDGLAKQLRGRSWYKDEEGSPVWEYLLRADILSGIGHYGVIFIGLNDGERDLSRPAKGVEEENSEPSEIPKEAQDKLREKGVEMPARRAANLVSNNDGRYRLTVNDDPTKGPSTKGRKITMLRVMPESQCQVVQWEQNATSPRYGQPVMYLMYFADPNLETTGTLGQPMAGRMVHWTRCVHVADRYHHAQASEVIAAPRIKPVLNSVLDVQKIRGASAEGYWKMAFALLSFETHPTLGPDVTVNTTEMKDLAERLQNSLQKIFYTQGFTAKSIAPSVVDPTPHIAVQTEAICIKLEIPVRVFKGSERGELASSQDDNAWNDRVQARQLYYITPWVIIPFIDRLIMLGVLPQPTEIEEKEVVDEEAQKKMEEEGADEEDTEGVGPLAQPTNGKRPVPFGKKPGVYNSRRKRTITRRRRVTRAVYNAMLTLNDFPPFRKVGGGDTVPTDDAPTDDLPEDPDEMVEIEEQVEVPTKVIKTEAGYCVEWPDITSMSAAEKATVFNTKMTGLSAAVSGGVAQLIGEHKILTEMGMDDEEATAALEEGAAAAEEQMQVDQEMMDEHGFKPDAAQAGMIDPEERDMEHEVEMAKAKNPGFGPGGGGAPFPPKKPFGKKKPAFNQRSVEEDEAVINVFCATGQGGGVDPGCGKDEGGAAGGGAVKEDFKKAAMRVNPAKGKELNRKLHEQGRLNKAIKNGLAGNATKAKAEAIKKELADLKKELKEEVMRAAPKQGAPVPIERERRKEKVEAKPAEPGASKHETALATSKVSTKENLGGGINGSYKVSLKTDEGTVQAVWKPADEERRARAGVPVGEYYKREAAAYSVAKAIGMDDMVPVTVEREINGKVGSVMKWVDNAKVAHRARNENDGETDRARAAAFDYLIGNTDRHNGNWMLQGEERGKDGKIQLIDHGLSFPTDGTASFISFLFRESKNLRIPAEVAKWDREKIRAAVSKHGITGKALDGVMTRLERMQNVLKGAGETGTFKDLPRRR